LSSADWREQVPGFLAETASAARVCRGYLYENYRDLHGKLRSKLMAKWVRRRDPAQPEILRELDFDADIYSDLRALLESNREVVGIREQSSDQIKSYLADKRITAQYILPVFVEDQWWGLLGFDEWYDERVWSPAECQAFRTAVRILGAAIRQSETSNRLSQIERLVRMQRDTTLQLSSVTDVDEALQSVAGGIRGFEMRTVAIRDQGAAGVKAVHFGWSKTLARLIEDQARRIIRSGDSLVDKYFSLSDLLRSKEFRPAVGDNVRSLALLPIHHGERVYGVIILGSLARDYIPLVWRETLEATSAEAAGVLIRIEAEQSAERNRERVRQANERYALATSAGRVGVWDYRRGGGFHISPLLQTILNIDGVPEGSPWLQLFKGVPRDNRGDLHRAVREMILGRAAGVETEIPIRHENGDLLWFSVRAHAYRDAFGRIERIIGTATDITAQKQLEDRLRKAREESDSASQAKSRFLAHMSHELKTPLNGIIGYAQVLQRNPNTTIEQRDAIDVISRSAGHLLRLIDDILDASRLETGRLSLTEDELNLPVFLQDLSEIVRIQAAERGLRFSLIKETNLPVFVRADEHRLRQILLNLLTNAVKFTKEGSVVLSVGWYEGNIRMSVKDTGIGIRSEDVERIFQPFFQAKRDDTTEGGSGLGLSITHQLLVLMGQQLHVETGGNGTEFWFLLPHREAEQAWDLATTEEYVAPLEELEPTRESSLRDGDIDELIHLAQIGDVQGIERYVELMAARDRVSPPFAERVLRCVREFRISDLKEMILSLKRKS
jgi:signal transduction histidine kinase